MVKKLIISLFSSATMYCWSPGALANATYSTRIGISVVVKGSQRCEFNYSIVGYAQSSHNNFSNCDSKTKTLQEKAEQVSFSHDHNNKQVRVVMTAQ